MTFKCELIESKTNQLRDVEEQINKLGVRLWVIATSLKNVILRAIGLLSYERARAAIPT